MQIAPAAMPAAASADPLRAIYDRYWRDLWSLPGIQSAGTSVADGGKITVTFANESFRVLADNILRDTIEGVQLVLSAASTGSPTREWWADNPREMARAVAAMPGVTEVINDSEHGVRSFLVSTNAQAVTDRLRMLVNTSFGGYQVNYWTRAPKP